MTIKRDVGVNGMESKDKAAVVVEPTEKEKSIDELVIELLDMSETEPNKEFEFTQDITDKIHLVADKCRCTNVYSRANGIACDKYVGKSNFDDMTAKDVYTFMLIKIINAPTRLHTWTVPRLLLPVISDKLKKEVSSS